MNIHKEFPLSQILWYKIGGTASFLLEVSSKEDIVKAFDFIEKNKIGKYYVLGFGSNLLFSDDYYDGVVIRFVHPQESSIILTKNGLVEAFAGEILDNIIVFSLKHNMIGLEWAGGLPGTVGAAIRGNVGAFGSEIKDVCVNAMVLKIESQGSEILHLNSEKLGFSYRNSIIKTKKNLIVVSGAFQLSSGGISKTAEARNMYLSHIEYRKENHPLGYPNCGSVFKNVVEKENVEKVLQVYPNLKENVDTKWHGKISMGALIVKLGLSGYKVGNAQVSQKHSNFIVNLGGAKFIDVVTIIRVIQKKIEDTFGFTPEVEVEIVK